MPCHICLRRTGERRYHYPVICPQTHEENPNGASAREKDGGAVSHVSDAGNSVSRRGVAPGK